MSSPDRAISRGSRLKEGLATAATLAVIPSVLLGSRVLYTRVDIPASSDGFNLNRYRRGRFYKQLSIKRTKGGRAFMENGETVAGQIGTRTVAVYDIEPDFGIEHDGRAMVRYDGKLKKRKRKGSTVITVQGGKTMYVYDGERKEVGNTGIMIGYSRPRKQA